MINEIMLALQFLMYHKNCMSTLLSTKHQPWESGDISIMPSFSNIIRTSHTVWFSGFEKAIFVSLHYKAVPFLRSLKMAFSLCWWPPVTLRCFRTIQLLPGIPCDHWTFLLLEGRVKCKCDLYGTWNMASNPCTCMLRVNHAPHTQICEK
jgi:hypothetical protein